MKIKMKLDTNNIYDGEILSFDKIQNLTITKDGMCTLVYKGQFELIQDEAALAPPKDKAGLPQIFGQELKRLEVEFK